MKIRNFVTAAVLAASIAGIAVLTVKEPLRNRSKSLATEASHDRSSHHATSTRFDKESPNPSLPPSEQLQYKNPKDWSKATVLSERIETTEGSGATQKRRHRIVSTPDFTYPIRITESLRLNEDGEETVERIISAYVANQIVLSSESELELREAEQIAEALGWTVRSHYPNSSLAVIETTKIELDTVETALAVLANANSVVTAEQNEILYALTAPNDPRYQLGHQSSLEPPEDFGINALAGWGVRTNSDSVIVAIVDSGIRLDHQDLAANLWTNEYEIPGNGIDDNQNGYVDDVHGINAIARDGDPSDDNGHGTHIAGIIGAGGNNGIGISGVAWHSNLMAIKALNDAGRGVASDVIVGIDYAGQNGAKVVNASWGTDVYSISLQYAIERLNEKGAVLVAAAGNDSLDIDIPKDRIFPAAYSNSNILSVANSTLDGSQTGTTNWGKRNVDIAAPGEDILSTWHTSTDAYTTQSGTSMSAAFATGILALTAAEYPDSSATELIDRICLTTTRSRNLSRVTKFGGIPNLYTCLTAQELPHVPILWSGSETDPIRFTGEDASFSVEAESDTEISYKWYLDDEIIPDETDPSIQILEIAPSDEGEYVLVATNDEGQAELSFFLDVLEPNPAFQTALDANSSITIYSPNNTPWRIASDKTSEGDQILEFPSDSPRGESNLYARVHGPATLRFRWFVDDQLNSGFSFRFGTESVSKTPQQRVWHYSEIDLPEDIEHTLAWWMFIYSKSSFLRPVLAKIDSIKSYPLNQAAPLIIEHPRDYEGTVDNRVALSLSAIGDDLSYQWYQNDSPLSGANEPSLNLGYLEETKSGTYYAIVTSPYGSEQSQNATVTFIDQADFPSFIEDTATFEYIVGDTAVLSLPFQGTEPLTFQWYRYDTPIPGATQSTLRFDPVGFVHGGTYKLRISNPLSPQGLLSRDVYLRLIQQGIPPRFSESPEITRDTKLAFGESTYIEPYAPENGHFEYQWFKDGIPIDGANDLKLFFESVSFEDQAVYYLEAKNEFGTAQSSRYATHITGQYAEALDFDDILFESSSAFLSPTSDLAYDGVDSVTLSAEGDPEHGAQSTLYANIEGPVNLSFYWRQSAGSQAALSLSIDGQNVIYAPPNGEWERSVVHIPEGEHDLRWTHSYTKKEEGAWLDQFSYTLTPAFTRVSDPQVLATVSTTRLFAEAAGEELNYHWYRNGLLIPSENDSDLILDTSSIQNSDRFQVVVSSPHGELRSHDIQVVTIESIFQDIPPQFSLGEQEPWTANVDSEYPNIKIELPPGQSASINYAPTEAANLAFDGYFSSGTDLHAYLDGEETTIHTYSSPQAPFSRRIEIPPSGGLLEIKIENTSDQLANISISFLKVTNQPLITRQTNILDTANNGYEQVEVAIVSTFENTIAWYKGTELVLTEILSDYYIARPDLEAYVSDQEISAAFHCVITDQNGLSTQSEDILVIRNITAQIALDSPETYLTVEGAKIAFDSEYKASGNHSIRLDIPSDSKLATIRIDAFIDEGHLPFTAKLRSSDPRLQMYLSDPLGSRRQVSLDATWEEVLLMTGEHWWDYIIEIENPSEIEGSIWIDQVEAYEGFVVLKQPKPFATFLGGSADFSIVTSNTKNANYQWYRDGIELPNATASTFSIEKTSLKDLGNYSVKVTQGNQTFYSDEVSLSFAPPIADAIEQPGLKISTWGDAFWFIDRENSVDGSWSIRSGELQTGQTSGIRFHFDEPGFAHYFSKQKYIPKHESISEDAWSHVEFTFLESDSTATIEVSLPNYPNLYTQAPQTIWVDRLSIQSVPIRNYRDWVASQDLPTLSREASFPIGDENADTDGDGIINLFEFALNLDPYTADQAPKISTEWENGKPVGELHYQALNLAGYKISLEFSTDLVNWWIAQPETETSIPSIDEPYRNVTSRFDLISEDGQPLYWRWRIARSETPSINLSSLRISTE
ncbi:S8 family serine peptidase [Pelagicoccus sp. SDUM812002]|uniref:S8 family serine peptidase n=1 Tax=Pelagicoccus sp. SDUM812002 TaxID=3041266 RepID=UPI00280C76F0|nr:S8 family serine peptidase [Pelagicoccus sp. SDUM812002]MDQ8185156.1 S8 family serine peptidase [Pelagicoccus sp. SDUM812002]